MIPKIKTRVVSKIKQIDVDKLRKDSLEYLSDLVLRTLHLQFSITAPILNTLLRLRGIDTNVDVKKMAFDRMKANMLWCIDNPGHADEREHVTADLAGELLDVYVEPVTRARAPQSAGVSLFAGPDAVKKAKEYIMANNKKRKQPVEIIEVAKAPKKSHRKPTGSRRKASRKSK